MTNLNCLRRWKCCKQHNQIIINNLEAVIIIRRSWRERVFVCVCNCVCMSECSLLSVCFRINKKLIFIKIHQLHHHHLCIEFSSCAENSQMHCALAYNDFFSKFQRKYNEFAKILKANMENDLAVYNYKEKQYTNSIRTPFQHVLVL